MKDLKYTLVADGSSDKTLLRIIKWTLDNLYPTLPNEGSFADFRFLPKPPKGLNEKVKTAMNYYPFNVVFIHRDAETTNPNIIEQRHTEIFDELDDELYPKIVCVIPIKMMETWLMIDPEAIKKAAGNRNYKAKIELPLLKNLEKENQPKVTLHELLRVASGLKSRNLKKFNTEKAVHLVAENIEDFSQLRNLVAFKAFENDLKKVVDHYLEN